MTKVIGFFGGPGLGKSTIAASVFSYLKAHGHSCELVLEVSKEWAWQGRQVGPFGQSILYGKQLERETRLYGKVDFIITDSPVALCPVYQDHYWGHDTIKHSILKDLETASKEGVTHLNFLLKRTTKYDCRGRFETEQLANHLDDKIKDFLITYNLPYFLVDPTDKSCIQYIVNESLKTNK